MLESIGRSRRTYKTTVNMSSIGERVAAKHEEEEHECPQRQTFKKESEPVAAAEEEARRLLKAAGLANDRTTSKKKRKSEKIPQTPKKKRGRKKLPLDQLKGAIDAVDPKTFEIKQSGVAGKALVEHLKSDRANESAWILERGQLLWFYRKKIDAEKPHSLADVQRLYMVMAPSPAENHIKQEDLKLEGSHGAVTKVGPKAAAATGEDEGEEEEVHDVSLKAPHYEDDHLTNALLRTLIITSKKMPHIGGFPAQHWAFVDHVQRGSKGLIDKIFAGREHDTKTRGHRVMSAAVPLAVASYQVIGHKKEGNRASHTHFQYCLQHEAGPVQKEFNILPTAGYHISVKNPELEPRDTSRKVGLPKHSRAHYPDELKALFKGKRVDQTRFHPLDPVSFLNYNHAEVILGGVTTDIEAEFHVLSEELLRMRDVHVKQKEREYQSVVDAVFGELQMDVKEFNKRSLATGNW